MENEQDYIGPTITAEQRLWLPDGSIICYEASGVEQLKIAIIAPSKYGKSLLAATAPRKPIWFWDTAGRLPAVSGKLGVFGKTYPETTTPYKSEAFSNIESDLQMFEYQKLKGNQIPGTMVIDDIDIFLDRVQRKVLVDNINNPKVTAQITINNKTFLSPLVGAYNQEAILMGNFIARNIELGCDVIAIFHERAEEAPDSTLKEKKFTGKLTVHPPRAEYLLPLFNEKWRVAPNYDGSKYEVTVTPTSDFVAATCMKIGPIEVANITEMVEKHKQKLQEEKEKGNG